MRHLLAFLLGFALVIVLTHNSPAAQPDEVRSEAEMRAMSAQHEAVAHDTKAPREGTSLAVAKPHTWIMTVRSPGQPLIFLQIYAERETCDRNRTLLSRQLGVLGWGRAACIEQVQP